MAEAMNEELARHEVELATEKLAGEKVLVGWTRYLAEDLCRSLQCGVQRLRGKCHASSPEDVHLEAAMVEDGVWHTAYANDMSGAWDSC